MNSGDTVAPDLRTSSVPRSPRIHGSSPAAPKISVPSYPAIENIIEIPMMNLPTPNSSTSRVRRAEIVADVTDKLRPRNSVQNIAPVPVLGTRPTNRVGTSSRVSIKLPPPKQPLFSPRMLLVVVIGVLSICVLLLSVLLVSTLRRNGMTAEERTALTHLRETGPKSLNDLQAVMLRLQGVNKVGEVHDFLGKPDFTYKDEISLWDPQNGTTKYFGPGFIAYRIGENGEHTAAAAADAPPVVNVVLFKVSEARAEYLGIKNHAVPSTPSASPVLAPQSH